MKKVVVSLVSAAALATITAGMAAATPSTVASQDFFNNDAAGVYVSGNLGYGHYNDKNVVAKDRRGFTWNANLGYQFNQYLAVEGGYIHFNGIKVQQAGSATNANLYGLDLVVKGILPINDQFNVFAKVGAMRLDGKLSSTTAQSAKSKIVPVFGVGAAYNINKQVAVDVQGLYTTAAKNSFRQTATVLAGVSYKFSV